MNKLGQTTTAYATHQSGQRQPVPKARHRRFEIARLEVLVDVLTVHGGIHVRPNQGNCASQNTAAFVRDLDGDIFLAFDDDHLDGRERVLVLRPVTFNDGAQRVLEQLKDDVGEMAGDVGEVEVFGADELDGGTFEHGVVFLANESGALVRCRKEEERERLVRTARSQWLRERSRGRSVGRISGRVKDDRGTPRRTDRVHMIPTKSGCG